MDAQSNPTPVEKPEPRCACHAASDYDCWRSRYNMHSASRSEVEFDGGPCQCSCHDRFACDDIEDEY